MSERCATLSAPARLCALQDAAGRVETCPGARCPFWEEGGAALEAGCGIERLALDLARPGLAQALLEERFVLDRARNGEEAAPVRSLFYRLSAAD